MRKLFVAVICFFTVGCNMTGSKLKAPLPVEQYHNYSCHQGSVPALPKCFSTRVLSSKQNGNCRKSTHYYHKALERYFRCQGAQFEQAIQSLSAKVLQLIKCHDAAKNPYGQQPVGKTHCGVIPNPTSGLADTPLVNNLSDEFPKCLQFDSFRPRTFAQWQACRPSAVKILRQTIPDFTRSYRDLLQDEFFNIYQESANKLNCYGSSQLYCLEEK